MSSTLARLDHNITVTKANQDARHAAEDGRDFARDQCVEAMGKVITARICQANDENITVSHKDLAELALDAAIASGYVVVNK